MEISLSVDSYKGVDGSSLSAARCSQIVKVFEMLQDVGDKNITYVEIQDLADKKKLFGSTCARSAIRTFFPLLKKIGFVNYDNVFQANKCFTNLGTQFVLASRALENVSENTPNKEEIIRRLGKIKSDAQKQGLINMYNSPDYKGHNMWIALKILKEFKVIHWNYFLYALHCCEKKYTIKQIIDDIKKNSENIKSFVFTNEKKEKLPNTCYSYIRSYLEEAGLIYKLSSMESKLTVDSDKFFSFINL